MATKKLTRAETQARTAEAVRLRRLGYDYDDIAKETGFADRSGAWRAVDRAMSRNVRETTNQVRQLELERLDMLLVQAFEVLNKDHVHVSNGRAAQAEVYATDEDGRVLFETDPDSGQRHPVVERYEPLYDDKPKLDAIKTIVKLMERRAKYLGLDAPTGGDPVHPEAVRTEIEEMATQLGIDPSAFDADIASLLDSAEAEAEEND